MNEKLSYLHINDEGYVIEPVERPLNDTDYVPSYPPTKRFINPRYDRTLGEFVEGYIAHEIITEIKSIKYKELDNACENTILGRFKSIIDGVEYEFSYDEKAQSRFNGTPHLFDSGIIGSINWTAYLNGKRTVVTLDKLKLDIVAKDAFIHQASNVEKFRQKVAELELLEDVPTIEALKWD